MGSRESKSLCDQNLTMDTFVESFYLSLSLNQSIKHHLSDTGGWLLTRGSCHGGSRQIQMQTLQKCICLRGHLENSCDDCTLQEQLLPVHPV